MKPACFYGRVSTSDMQDPEASRGWQLRIAHELAERTGHEIVAEFFDQDSRQLPWRLRPVTSMILEQLRDPGRGWDAVFIAEPHRAFMGNQWAEVVALFDHHGVTLYAPEFPTGYEPSNIGHTIQISVMGSLSEAEIDRTRTRVTTAMEDQTEREGRFLGSRPPYGYMLVDNGPHPNPSKARVGQRLNTFALDPLAAPIVRRMFDEYLAGRGFRQIAKGLALDGIAPPSVHDAERNKNRTGDRSWSTSTVRSIVLNPRYTGHQVWARTRGKRELRNLDDVALGYRKLMKAAPRDEWIWSDEPSHPAIISRDEHELVIARLGAKVDAHGKRSTKKPYRARGILFCGICGRRMGGHWYRTQPAYRCRYPAERAQPPGAEHPRTLYLLERAFFPQLANWLAGLFDPEHLDATCEQLALAASQKLPTAADAERRQAETALKDAQRRIDGAEDLLAAGADAEVVAGMINRAVADRSAAQARLNALQPRSAPTAAELKAALADLPSPSQIFFDGEPDDVQRLLNALGVSLVYHPDEGRIVASSSPPCCATDGVGGGT